MRKIEGKNIAIAGLAVLLCLSVGTNLWQRRQSTRMQAQLAMNSQREMADVTAAMADIEVNLSKLLIASGAAQSVSLLGETAMLASTVESGLARIPMDAEEASGAMKFAGQMGQYTLALASDLSDGGMLTSQDEAQLTQMMSACRRLSDHLLGMSSASDVPDAPDMEAGEGGDTAIPYPSLIYDGPFSDGRHEGQARGLTGERVTREQARQAAARYAGVTVESVRDAADSGGIFEAFGFEADTPQGVLSVQVTGQGAHLLWMVPQQAQFTARRTQEECLENARVYLADMGFGQMESCFVQEYDGMVVANFAGVQDGVLLYPDQVKVQVSMDTGIVVGAECSQYLMNHMQRTGLDAALTDEEARQMLSPKLDISSGRLCVIPINDGERLCWGYRGTFAGASYYVFIDANTGEAAQILRVVDTPDGETAV